MPAFPHPNPVPAVRPQADEANLQLLRAGYFEALRPMVRTTKRQSFDIQGSNMNHTIRVLVSLIASSFLTTASFVDGVEESVGCNYEVCPNDPPKDGILFVDNCPTGRSGHLGHALVEYEDGKILALSNGRGGGPSKLMPFL